MIQQSAPDVPIEEPNYSVFWDHEVREFPSSFLSERWFKTYCALIHETNVTASITSILPVARFFLTLCSLDYKMLTNIQIIGTYLKLQGFSFEEVVVHLKRLFPSVKQDLQNSIKTCFKLTISGEFWYPSHQEAGKISYVDG